MTVPAVSFTVPGEPVAWARPMPRIIKPKFKPSFIGFYTKKENDRYKDVIATLARQAMAGRPPIDQSVELCVKAFIPVPASWSKKKAGQCLSGFLRPPSVPDIDNYAKAPLDACNKIVYRDDSLICTLLAEKHYSDNPRLEVEVWLF